MRPAVPRGSTLLDLVSRGPIHRPSLNRWELRRAKWVPDGWPVVFVATLVSVVIGLAVGSQSTGLLLLVCMPFVGAVLVSSLIWPDRAFSLIVAALVLVPLYGIPQLRAFAHPALFFFWAIGLAGIVTAGKGFTWIDACALLILAGHVLSWQLGHEPFLAFFRHLWLWGGPYLAARYLARTGRITAILWGLVIAGVAALPFLLIELSSSNPFIQAFPSATSTPSFGQRLGIGIVQQRLGFDRAQGALGQSIPYAMFLSTAALSALVLWASRRRRGSAKLLIVACALVAGQACALARTGWIVFIGGVLLLAVLAPRRFFMGRNQVIVVGVFAIVAVGISIGPSRELLFGGGDASEQASLQASAKYRSTLLDAATKPEAISAFGAPRVDLSASIDNAYLLLGTEWGYLPMFGLLLLLPVALALVWRYRGNAINVFIFGLVALNLVVLFGVPLITQGQSLVWLTFGAAAGHAAWLRRSTAGSSRALAPRTTAR